MSSGGVLPEQVPTKAILAAGVVAAIAVVPLSGSALVPALVLLSAAVAALLIARRQDVRQRLEVEGELLMLRRQCRIDPLTGLLNRSAFLEELELLNQRSVDKVVVIYFDLNRFKEVNDTFGHRIGDRLLVEVANRCRRVLPDTALIARLSGDEYAAAVELQGNESPLSHGLTLHRVICEPTEIEGTCIHVGSSVGVAIGPRDCDAATLLQEADFAMYEAKRGPTPCRIYDEELVRRHRVEATIRQEIANPSWLAELSMVYQPILDLKTGRATLYEALLRWRSPKIGEIPPSTLIPIAEDCGKIEEITEWTLAQSLHTAKRNGISVAVNISPVYFRHPEFVHRVFDRLLEFDVHPECLTVELTEGVMIDDIGRATEIIARLRDTGIRVVLDDFGTGFSSLSYLQNFALDGLKLDKSFLRDLGSKSQATKIIKTMVEFGHSLDMRVVIEGVENEWQFRLLQLIGCDLAQGYLIGTPVPADQLPQGGLSDLVLPPVAEPAKMKRSAG